MKGDVNALCELVDSYILELKNSITDLKIEAMAKGCLPIYKKAKLAEIENRLNYVKRKKDLAINIDVDFIDTGKSIEPPK